jgi:hypothetical protein
VADESILVVWPVEEMPDPNPDSVRGHYCSKCGIEVWVMPKNLTLGFRMICLTCSAKLEEIVAVRPASAAHKIKNAENN